MNKMFQEEKNRTKEKIRGLEKRFVRISWGRVMVFITAIVCLSFGLSRGNALLLAAAALCLVGFLVLVSIHGHVSLDLQDEKTRENVIDSYMKRMNNEWKDFPDDGEDLMGKNDHASFDLDIAGRASLYQLLHICHTEEGRRKFYAALQPPAELPENVEERRAAIRELSGRFSFLCALESVTTRITAKMKKKRSFLMEETEDGKKEEEKQKKQTGFPAWMQLARFIIPAVMTVLTVFTVMGVTSPGILIIFFLVFLVVTLTPGDSILSMMLPVFRFGQSAKDLIGLLELIAKEDFQSSILSDMKEKISRKGGILSAAAQMRRIGQAQSLSYNTIIHLLLNGFLAWDFHVGYAAYKWNEKNGALYLECMDVIASFEELGSFAVLPIVRKTCVPRKGGGKLVGEEIYHPLLAQDTVVANDVSFGADVTIITGSNMSGKTTLMRTLALNLCLMYAGAEVCAESFSAGFYRLFTSMRIRDDVTGGISTFYAEILRIKEMADYVGQGKEIPALCMIDEIFKGTNSADRIAGAKEAIRTLSSGNCMTIVTTHDFELCDMKTAAGKDAENYHFEEYYEGDNIRFDYKIREGRCTTRNARALLTMAGLFHE